MTKTMYGRGKSFWSSRENGERTQSEVRSKQARLFQTVSTLVTNNREENKQDICPTKVERSKMRMVKVAAQSNDVNAG